MLTVLTVILILLALWLIYALSAVKYRISDAAARREFARAGIPLFIDTKTIAGFPIHYAVTGDKDKPTLFFVHGSPGSWTKFRHYLRDKELLSKYRMVSIDRPGFGYSRFGDAKNLSGQSQLISALLHWLHNGQAVYAIGPSLGGPLVVRLAIDNPGTFSGLVLLAASIDPAAERPEKWRGFFALPLIEYLAPGAWRPSNKEIWLLKKDLPELVNGFATITCPVHVLHGDKDPWVDVSNAAYAERMLVNAASVTVTIIAGATHSVVNNYFGLIKATLMQLK